MSYYGHYKSDLTRQLSWRYGHQIPARDQETPSQSHSSGSYLETGMGLTERLDRNGWEPLDTRQRFPELKPARTYEI